MSQSESQRQRELNLWERELDLREREMERREKAREASLSPGELIDEAIVNAFKKRREVKP